eukprot:9493221-Pyramimonas_sp.AAC.1
MLHDLPTNQHLGRMVFLNSGRCYQASVRTLNSVALCPLAYSTMHWKNRKHLKTASRACSARMDEADAAGDVDETFD